MVANKETASDSELGHGRTCFIVAPIGNRLEPHGSPGRARYEESAVIWEEVIEPACALFGLAPVRADRISDTGEIPQQIFEYLRDADVVIADLSHANPNVMYELGLRHSRPTGITVQIGEYGLLPFDVTTIRTIQFNRTAAGLIGARDDLIEALRTALTKGGTPLRATSVFNSGSLRPAEVVSADVARSIAPDEQEVAPDEPGFLEVLVEGEEAIEHIAAVLASAQVQLVTVGEFSKDAGARMPSSFAGRLQVARELAETLREPADHLEADGNEFYADVRSVDAMMQYVFQRLESGEESVAKAEEFLTSIVSLIDAAEEGAVGMTSFRNGAPQLRKIARDLEPVSSTLQRSASRFLEGIAMMSAWRETSEALLQQARLSGFDSSEPPGI